MGSYSSPAYLNVAEKVVVDNTYIDDEVVIGPLRCWNPQLIYETSALWDGTVIVEYLLEDDSYSTWTSISAADRQFIGTLYQLSISTYFKRPLTLRARVDAQASLGACTLRLLAHPWPANPLF